MRYACLAAAALALSCAPTDQAPSGNTGTSPPATRAITVNASGPGSISGAGISGCHGQCTAQVADGATVTLTATPDLGAVFSGWSQACSGSGACSFTVSGDAQVTATFAMVPPPPAGKHNLIVARTGGGSVVSTPPGIDCGGTCAGSFAEGTVVSLSATPDAGQSFSGWGGACSGTAGCTVVLGADVSVSAAFAELKPVRHTLTVTRGGDGRVVSTPAGIDCGDGCAASFTAGSTVSLVATPGAGSSFTGWSGACSGTGACNVSMAGDAAVTATFAATPVDECAGLNPAAPGAPVRAQLATGPGQACDEGHADGKGTLALGFHGGGSSLHFFDPAGNPLGNFVGQSGNLQLDEQAEGVIAVDAGSRYSSPSVEWVKADGTVGGRSTAGGNAYVQSVDDPTGGVVLATFVFPAAYPNSLEAYDAHGAPRWKVSRSDGEVYLAHGVDRLGNTLLITRVGATDNAHGTWFDRNGNPQPGSVAMGAWGPYLQLVPRIGGGFFLQRLTNDRYAPDSYAAQFVAQIDTLGTAFTGPPAWLYKYDRLKLHPARGGTAYAFIDQSGHPSDCTQRIQIVATTGKACGSASFNAGVNGACQTAAINVAWDGTVVQQLAPQTEAHDPAGSQVSCTWQWWPGLLR